MEGVSMKETFSRIHAFAINKGGSLREYGKRVGDDWIWDISLRRPYFGWKMEQWNAFITSLLEITIFDSTPDTVDVKIPKMGNWIPPESETLMFNIDESARGSPDFFGIWGVLHDQSGKVFCSFLLSVGWQEAVTTEILVIAKACDLCASKTQLKNRKIVISSDCLVAVSWINSSDIGNFNLLNMIYGIRNLLCTLGQTRIQFSSRVSNLYADMLAKRVADGDRDVIT
ncbi:hypothetical protein Ddye_006383 [Dipteronia dyeriana]|uniref:RNase H type-1 domain-containing protein n=1 Tax=Dipteronia dyeriana TaxID=168575 RepID=A0AAD9XHY5_9ROSI|nr:hypothetical protein Ddye_006383 [Dipteronia dyeriana]